MIANLLEKNIARVISYILISPGSRWRRKEIKEKTEMNNIPLDAVLQQLLALRILKEKKHLLELNFENKEVHEILTHLKKEYTSFNVPYIIFNILTEISAKFSKEKGILQTILFGSYAKLIYTDKSDVDIAVILSPAVKSSSLLEKKAQKIAEKLGNKYKKRIELHFFKENDLQKRDPLVQEIQRNGKALF